MQATETPKSQRSDPKKIIVNDLRKSIYLDIKVLKGTQYFKLSFLSYQLSLQSFLVLPLLVLPRNFLWLLLLIQLQQWGLATGSTTKKLPVTALTNSISTVSAWLWNIVNNNFFGIYNQAYASFTPLTVFPFTHSVARELEAIAEPQPKVLNLASTILPSSSILIWNKDKFLNTYYYAKKN